MQGAEREKNFFSLFQIIERKRNVNSPASLMNPSRQCPGWRELPHSETGKEPHNRLHKIICFVFLIKIFFVPNGALIPVNTVLTILKRGLSTLAILYLIYVHLQIFFSSVMDTKLQLCLWLCVCVVGRQGHTEKTEGNSRLPIIIKEMEKVLKVLRVVGTVILIFLLKQT